MDRTQKEEMVAELHGEFVATQGAVITTYSGLSVANLTAIRNIFREEGAKFRVVKNTLARIATNDTELSVLADDFVGPTALAYSLEDPVAAARAAKKAAKEYEKLEIRAGFGGGGRLDATGVQALADLPTLDELRSKLLSVLNGPASKFVRVLNAVPQQVVTLLTAYEDKLKEGGE